MMFSYLKGLLFGYRIFRYSDSQKREKWDFGQWLAYYIYDIGGLQTEIRLRTRNIDLSDDAMYDLYLRNKEIYIMSVNLIEERDCYNVKVNGNPKLTIKSSQKLNYLILRALGEFNSYALKNNSHVWAKINAALK